MRRRRPTAAGRARLAAVVLGAALAAAGLGGCGSGRAASRSAGGGAAAPAEQVIPGAGGEGSATTAPTGAASAGLAGAATTAPVAGPQGGGAQGGGGQGAGAPAANGPPCRSSQLAVKVVDAKQGSVGYSDWLFEVRNTSTSACTVAGWPTVVLLDGNRKPLVTNEKRGAGPALTGRVATTVPLPAGAAAVFGIETYGCSSAATSQPPAPQLLVTPPTDTVALLTPVTPPVTSCTDGLVVTSPVRADPSGVAS